MCHGSRERDGLHRNPLRVHIGDSFLEIHHAMWQRPLKTMFVLDVYTLAIRAIFDPEALPIFSNYVEILLRKIVRMNVDCLNWRDGVVWHWLSPDFCEVTIPKGPS